MHIIATLIIIIVFFFVETFTIIYIISLRLGNNI